MPPDPLVPAPGVRTVALEVAVAVSESFPTPLTCRQTSVPAVVMIIREGFRLGLKVIAEAILLSDPGWLLFFQRASAARLSRTMMKGKRGKHSRPGTQEA